MKYVRTVERIDILIFGNEGLTRNAVDKLEVHHLCPVCQGLNATINFAIFAFFRWFAKFCGATIFR